MPAACLLSHAFSPYVHTIPVCAVNLVEVHNKPLPIRKYAFIGLLKLIADIRMYRWRGLAC
ncbi:hypothetical protein CIPAW_11G000700 [Carya illinoinensis]|uniref:Uncharacterized protein n=1 Tax=Carya illinoinensis TaxID=32201 RepID=A0A8T1NXD7_CARIL|nr:hypothetical protein CIPAW_11G000700 [Carya illinoinensis]